MHMVDGTKRHSVLAAPESAKFVQIMSRLPAKQRDELCQRLQSHPAIGRLHKMLKSTLIDATEDEICSIAMLKARGYTAHYPPNLGSMLCCVLDTLPEPTGKVKALVLHACAKTKCRGVRKRLVSRVASRALASEFEGWDLQSISMYVQSIWELRYTSKVTYRIAAKAALERCSEPGAVRDSRFMKALSLLLWALAKANRTMSAPASELFSIAAHQLLTSSQGAVLSPSKLINAASALEVDVPADLSSCASAEVPILRESISPGDAACTEPSEASSMCSYNMQDCSLLLWAITTAAHARIEQFGGTAREDEWRGSADGIAGHRRSHPSINSRSKELLAQHWGSVPVMEAVTKTLDVIAEQKADIEVCSYTMLPDLVYFFS
jgi:hypothetical protein